MKIILASKSKVRKDILTEHNIDCEVIQSNVDENPIKAALTTSGDLKILTVTSVITPSKPSDPVISPKKS